MATTEYTLISGGQVQPNTLGFDIAARRSYGGTTYPYPTTITDPFGQYNADFKVCEVDSTEIDITYIDKVSWKLSSYTEAIHLVLGPAPAPTGTSFPTDGSKCLAVYDNDGGTQGGSTGSKNISSLTGNYVIFFRPTPQSSGKVSGPLYGYVEELKVYADFFDVTTTTSHGTVTGAGTYIKNSTATVTATPDAGYKFKNGTKGGVEVSTSPTYSFTVTADTDLVANFQIAFNRGHIIICG